MTRFRSLTSRTSLVHSNAVIVIGACALLLVSGCSAFRSDSSDKKAGSYEVPDLDTLDEAPPIPYSEVYVPVDVHAYQKDGKKLPLSATLVLRNPNRTGSLVVKKVDLYGQDGRRIRRVAEDAFELRPFASVEFLATARGDAESRHASNDEPAVDLDADKRRSSVPSHFIVQWGSVDDAEAPLIETVMVDSDGKILYARPGHEIRKIPANQPEPQRPVAHLREPRSPHQFHASVTPEYELIRYDSNMGLSRKDP